MKNLALALLAICVSSSYAPPKLAGNWIFKGGIYNGKKEGAPKEYTLQRKYQSGTFNAFLLEKGQKPLKYQSGKYTIGDKEYLETETYSMQQSKMKGKTVKYQYTIRHDSLILIGVLPTGMTVEEYWKRSK
ncbi:hypothetical protein [Mucilaginibacter myungsuensis]|uniref:Lipocalin-like protein n=1 Tax=Mucilaginibacter myungsuensis TaxID=649104 RepID=A0A929KSH9_9SPHI|nr:hypothetical protein [Mucilaginibacter myungsuensis]MBE9660357.1 hypothetical protein [Mucilaginibacter myungsuensis]MDN3600399.1 hypothetical protein [Mucilaginibacter myungsuensis]